MRVALEQSHRRLVAVGADHHEDGQRIDRIRHRPVVADPFLRTRRPPSFSRKQRRGKVR